MGVACAWYNNSMSSTIKTRVNDDSVEDFIDRVEDDTGYTIQSTTGNRVTVTASSADDGDVELFHKGISG